MSHPVITHAIFKEMFRRLLVAKRPMSRKELFAGYKLSIPSQGRMLRRLRSTGYLSVEQARRGNNSFYTIIDVAKAKELISDDVAISKILWKGHEDDLDTVISKLLEGHNDDENPSLTVQDEPEAEPVGESSESQAAVIRLDALGEMSKAQLELMQQLYNVVADFAARLAKVEEGVNSLVHDLRGN